MNFSRPITFEPLPMQRIWGGHRLIKKLGKSFPSGIPIGESWELVDREDAQSIVNDGEHAGRSLHELWSRHRRAVFGEVADTARFPLLAKILDARETLSVQVHPPANVAPMLHGDPKTEVWYLLDAMPESRLFAGFKPGTTRACFEAAISSGTVADLLHSVPVSTGDAMFIPSGRCHAIGAGCLIVEIQQNSDTTYRVFDWDRVGLDGKPRALHITESLQSIDFTDIAPCVIPRDQPLIADCAYFRVERRGAPHECEPGKCAIFTVISGSVRCGGREFHPGDFFLLPATAEDRKITACSGDAYFLKTTF